MITDDKKMETILVKLKYNGVIAQIMSLKYNYQQRGSENGTKKATIQTFQKSTQIQQS